MGAVEGMGAFSAEWPDGEELTDMLFFYNQLAELLNLSYVFTQKFEQDK
ncbi:hypothetical protein GJU39_12945 [Pedobacter petrophilus]|uniref:Uncharacterized protein n=2 Tax=Pedobacter TaxID=84567 RepID=A0A7K0FZG9_9SPHI|nr:hypothetical protein [Pedobacter petrophilus]MRX76993.1 hypothetical protein [Pedobacter petrophilus]